MPRRAHRRCKEQGPTCLGITHPGFDICSRCLYDVVRPRMRAVKQEAKMRKANRLSHANRDLINRVDLDEPQMRPTPPSITEVIDRMSIEREAHELVAKHDGDALAALHEVKMRNFLDVPVIVDRAPESLKEEPMPEPVLELPAKRNSGRTGRASKLTEQQWQEVIDAYTSGMSTSEICRAWDIGTGSLYQRLARMNIPTRKSQEAPVATKTSTTISHQVVEPAPTNGVVSGLTEWTVIYTTVTTETVTVHAKDFNAAARSVVEAATGRNIEVISVSKVIH